ARLQHTDEADALLTRALAIRERVFGPDDVNVAGTLVALADVRGHQHRFDEGIELDKRALAISLKTYGPEHRRVAIPLHKIGLLYDSKGDYTTALTYYQRALDLRKKLLGSEHEMTLFTMTLYGAALAKLHRCAEARPMLATAEAGLLPK